MAVAQESGKHVESTRQRIDTGGQRIQFVGTLGIGRTNHIDIGLWQCVVCIHLLLQRIIGLLHALLTVEDRPEVDAIIARGKICSLQCRYDIHELRHRLIHQIIDNPGHPLYCSDVIADIRHLLRDVPPGPVSNGGCLSRLLLDLR